MVPFGMKKISMSTGVPGPICVAGIRKFRGVVGAKADTSVVGVNVTPTWNWQKSMLGKSAVTEKQALVKATVAVNCKPKSV
jgi:hypothetical protein